jgi:uncharacterized membrane protein YciS (DUF1049 family)
LAWWVQTIKINYCQNYYLPPIDAIGYINGTILGLAIQLSFYEILQRAGLVFLLVLSAIVISLAIACLGHNNPQQITNNAILEQVPLTASAILAVTIEFLFCCIVLLPLNWTLFLSITVPILCLIGQVIWLYRIYYST